MKHNLCCQYYNVISTSLSLQKMELKPTEELQRLLLRTTNVMYHKHFYLSVQLVSFYFTVYKAIQPMFDASISDEHFLVLK